MKIETTDWFDASTSEPQRHGWYEVQLSGGTETAFAKFDEHGWTEKPVLAFTAWRGLSADPAKGGETGTIDAEVSVATGVRAVWDAFFPSMADHGDSANGAAKPDH